MKIEDALRAVPPTTVRRGVLLSEVGGYPAGTEVRLVERSAIGWRVQVPQYYGDQIGLPLWVLESQVRET